jgi:L-amino acid N-acyltransferase YncA
MIRRNIQLYKRRIAVSLRDFGFKHTLLRIIGDTFLSHFFLIRKYIIYEKQLSGLDSLKLRNPHLEFSFISVHDNKTLDQIENLSALPREMVFEKISKNGECVVAKDDGRLVGFNLVSTGNAHVRYLDSYLHLSESEAWSEQITVHPRFRQSGLATDLRHLMFDSLIKRGYTKLIGGYVPFNVKSGLLAKKLGFIEREKVTLVKIFNRKKLYRQTLSADPLKPMTLFVSNKRSRLSQY